MRKVVEPLVEMLRPIPPLAMLPMFIVWVGIGEGSKIGLHHLRDVLSRCSSRPCTACNRWIRCWCARRGASARGGLQLFTRVILPAALPEILTGIRLGVALAFFVIVISEFIGAEQGLGYLINDGRNFFLVPQMLGAAVAPRSPRICRQRARRLVGRRCLRWEQLGIDVSAPGRRSG